MNRVFGWIMLLLAGAASGEGLIKGDQIRVTLRGVEAAESAKVNGEYTVAADGSVALPFLDGNRVKALGMTTDQLARAVEAAYRSAGIYSTPAIDVTAAKEVQAEGAFVSVGGEVKRAGRVPFQQDMTVLQAVDAAGGRSPFGSRNLTLFREGKAYPLDFNKLRHKNIRLRSGDSLQIEQKGVIDRWKGRDEMVRPLLPERRE